MFQHLNIQVFQIVVNTLEVEAVAETIQVVEVEYLEHQHQHFVEQHNMEQVMVDHVIQVVEVLQLVQTEVEAVVEHMHQQVDKLVEQVVQE